MELSSATTEHYPSNHPAVDCKCNTIKLEPTWTREYLYGQKVADPSLKVIIQFKKASAVRPRREDIYPYDCIVKAFWVQWERLEFPEQVPVLEMGGGK